MVKYWFPKPTIQVQFLFLLKKIRVCSLMVKHIAHNDRNVGSTPTKLKRIKKIKLN